MGAQNQHGSTVSLPVDQPSLQPDQLYGLYGVLQGFYPDWSRQNPFWPLVQGRSDAQLSEMFVTWTHCIEHAKAQLSAAVPTG